MDQTDVLRRPDVLGKPPCEHDEIDAFLEHMRELTGETRRRLRTQSGRAAPSRHKAPDEPPPPPRIDLVLYVSAASEKSRKALRAIQSVLELYVSSQVKFATCDLSERPQEGEVDAVLFTPTLVKLGPGPRTSIIGNLDHHQDILTDLLDASGVDRRRWDD